MKMKTAIRIICITVFVCVIFQLLYGIWVEEKTKQNNITHVIENFTPGIYTVINSNLRKARKLKESFIKDSKTHIKRMIRKSGF